PSPNGIRCSKARCLKTTTRRERNENGKWKIEDRGKDAAPCLNPPSSILSPQSASFMTDLVGHFLIFTVAILAALAGPLILGRLVRPFNPTREKLAVYECGEPTIGSSHVQFDLRFYVVALLFIVFDIEVAFFFPWSVIYGTTMHLSDERLPVVTA